MLTGGGLLVWATSEIGWYGLFNAMGALLVGLLVLTLFIREPVSTADSPGVPTAERVRFAQIWARLRSAFRQASAAPLIAVVMTYKLGESLSDAMWKPLLFDRGFPAAQIGLWSGTFGLICSLTGSLAGGALARAIGIPAALLWIAAFRACGVGGQLWLSLTPQPTAADVIAVTCIEDLFGGAITPVVFALMMRHTDRAIGGTHYTLLASLEVWGKLPLAALSGVLAAQLGYSAVFGLGTALCVAFAIMVRAIRARLST
jgi:MFS transporter, PAT family, beta-lactamase induction signal transducer AmpG